MGTLASTGVRLHSANETKHRNSKTLLQNEIDARAIREENARARLESN
jgi:hypothetical protein